MMEKPTQRPLRRMEYYEVLYVMEEAIEHIRMAMDEMRGCEECANFFDALSGIDSDMQPLYTKLAEHDEQEYEKDRNCWPQRRSYEEEPEWEW